jgi:phospholipid/cholesterol/gamma-HCH transport system permease protein
MSESVEQLKIPVQFTNLVEFVGTSVIGSIGKLGSFLVFLKEIVVWTFRPPFRFSLLVQQLEFIGNQSLNIILMSALAVGAAFGLQIGGIFQVFGAESMLGAATAKALCQEMGPLVTLVLVTGRAGSSMTAEISTMKVNEQVDAMEAMAVDPISYLVVPRVLASMMIVPLLCAVFIFVGVIGSYISGVLFYDVDEGLFISKLTILVEPVDIWRGLYKSFAFSIIMGAVCCRYGLNASGGAKGVGKATTNSVVVSILSILGLDVIFTYFQVVAA